MAIYKHKSEYTYGDIDNLLKNADNVAQAVITTEASKEAAAQAEANAAVSEAAAETSAINAQQSENNANVSETNAAESATNAINSATAAEESVEKYPYINVDTNTWFKWNAESGVFVDTGVSSIGEKGDPGLFPRITVTGITTGSVVTATKNEIIVTGIENPTGAWQIDIPDYGDWNVKAILGADKAEKIVSIQSVQNYMIELSYPPEFIDATWLQVISAAESNQIPSKWQLKDKKPLTLKDGRTIDIEIVAKNRGELVGGGTATLILGFVDCLENKRVNATNTNIGGWEDSELRAYCNSDLYNQFPDDFKIAIKKAIKKSSAGNTSTLIITTEDYLWLYSATEVFPNPSSSYSPGGEGELFPIFTDNASRIKRLDGSPQRWWLRSPHVSSDASFCFVYTSGSITYSGAPSAYGVVLGFCLGGAA